jgi:hypothetical protein
MLFMVRHIPEESKTVTADTQTILFNETSPKYFTQRRINDSLVTK